MFGALATMFTAVSRCSVEIATLRALQELDADQQSLLVLPSQLFQPLAKGTKARVVQVSTEMLGDPDLDLLRLLLRIRRAEHGVEHVGVELQRRNP